MQRVLITGSNRGLGLEFVRQYAADGARVFATCRQPEAAEALAEIAQQSKNVSLHQLVAGDPVSARSLASQLSTESIDILINNAGVTGPKHQRFGNLDYDGFLEAFRVNTLGPTQVCEAFLPHVERSERKIMVTITSGMGSISESSGGYTIYRTTKAAVNMAMHSLAPELARKGIICVVMNPGWVQTDMGGPSATITPRESISGMRAVIDELTLADSGRFLDYRKGKTFGW